MSGRKKDSSSSPRDSTQNRAVRWVLKVVPGSSRSAVAGWFGDALRIRVRAPAEGGKANAAVEELLADVLGLSRDSVRIVRGHSSARKLVDLAGLSEAELRERLSKVLQSR